MDVERLAGRGGGWARGDVAPPREGPSSHPPQTNWRKGGLIRTAKRTLMSPLRSYETTVIDESGLLQAQILALPSIFEAGQPADLRGWLEGNGMRVQQIVDSAASSLFYALEELALQAASGPADVVSLAYEVRDEPIVVLESSAPLGRALGGLASQGVALVALAAGGPLLAVVSEAALVLVWFAAGPVIGIREGLREASRESTRKVASEVMEQWMRERLARRTRGTHDQ